MMTEIEKEQYEALKVAYKLFGQGDLMKFFLFEEHRLIDKWVHYFNVYEKWFSSYRGKDIVFVEIGVYQGGSLQMWKNYFGKDAKIIGVDVDERCKEFEEMGGVFLSKSAHNRIEIFGRRSKKNILASTFSLTTADT